MITANSIPLQLNIESRPLNTEIYFGPSLEILATLLNKKKAKAALITDQTIEEKYSHLLHECALPTIAIPSGEVHKARKTKEWIEDALLDRQFSKDSLLIALGGGTLMDITAFVASTFCRGVPLILIPTTLLGMVDACLGGKTAVNTPQGKNLIGSFYFPESIIIDASFLDSLPAKQRLNGKAEMIKYGLIHSKPLFEKLEAGTPAQTLIADCLEIKKELVESDPYEEKGIRRILNFGHTIGHALEQIERYQIEHGEAIAIGLLLESWLSMRLGYLQQKDFERIANICRQFPLKLSRRPSIHEMATAFSRDKKAAQAAARFVLLKEIGEVMPFDGDYCTPVDLKLIEEALALL